MQDFNSQSPAPAPACEPVLLLTLQRDTGHWEDPGGPLRFLPPTPLELSSVSTIVHRLQTAFQEAMDLYNLVSRAPGSEAWARGLPGTACLSWLGGGP